MRKLLVALVALVLAGTTLMLTSPAQGQGSTWHTMFHNRKARFQACKSVTGVDQFNGQTRYQVSWRVNNRRGSRWVQFQETTIDNEGTVLITASIPWVAPGHKKGPVSHAPEVDSDVVHLSTKYGHHRKNGTVPVAAIGAC